MKDTSYQSLPERGLASSYRGRCRFFQVARCAGSHAPNNLHPEFPQGIMEVGNNVNISITFTSSVVLFLTFLLQLLSKKGKKNVLNQLSATLSESSSVCKYVVFTKKVKHAY